MNFEINVFHGAPGDPCARPSISILHLIHNALRSLPMLESLPRLFLSEAI